MKTMIFILGGVVLLVIGGLLMANIALCILMLRYSNRLNESTR